MFRGNKFAKISGEKTSDTNIQSNNNANPSTALPFTKTSIDNNFISSSGKKPKHTRIITVLKNTYRL